MILLTLSGIYLAIGLLFSFPFVFFGARVIDPAAVGGRIGFKLLIIPGSVIFWPYLLKRWLSKTPPPEEKSAHRQSAGH